MWIFGYGSLVWKVDFPYTKKLVGYIKGYERRFWQASIDHRGTPDKPGRVVTLVPSSDPETQVWGAAYKIDDTKLDEVLSHLDHREVMGYEKVPILFHPVASHPLNSPISISSNPNETNNRSKPFDVTMYYGSGENEHYLGEAPLEEIARTIWECQGPSGSNKDYLFNLVNAMRQIEQSLPKSFTLEESSSTSPITCIDSHLAQLEASVLQLQSQHSAENIDNNLSQVKNHHSR